MVKKTGKTSNPLVYETHNICELTAKSKSSKFSVQLFKDICGHFELEVTATTKTTKRITKKPYVDLINGFMANCSKSC